MHFSFDIYTWINCMKTHKQMHSLSPTHTHTVSLLEVKGNAMRWTISIINSYALEKLLRPFIRRSGYHSTFFKAFEIDTTTFALLDVIVCCLVWYCHIIMHRTHFPRSIGTKGTATPCIFKQRFFFWNNVVHLLFRCWPHTLTLTLTRI